MDKLPNSLNLKNLINDLRIFSWEAADILLHYAQKIKDNKYKSQIIQTKENNDPVTLADLEVNNLIIKSIQENYAGINWNILSEENTGLISRNSDWLWVLDPLDGTKDFIQDTGNYAMHLALNYKNKPFLGVVLIPSKEELWISNGQKVWCENRNKLIKEPKLATNKFIKNMVLVKSKNHNNSILNSLIDKLQFDKVITMGSIGCKIASLLRGEADIYISLSLPEQSSPKDWDLAAPEVILRTAGGSITDCEGNVLSYNKNNYKQEGIIIATRDNLNHKVICQQIKKIIENYKYFD